MKLSTKALASQLLGGWLTIAGTGLSFAQEPSVSFTAPGENNALRSTEWAQSAIKHDQSLADVDLVIALDQQQYNMLGPLIHAFSVENDLKIAVSDGTCGISAGLLVKRKIDIGGFCCPPAINDRLPGLRFHTLGIAAIAMLVHPENPVDDVTVAEARSLFSGQSSNWNQLERIRTDASVVPVGRLHCKQRPGHWRLLLPDEDKFSPWLLEVGSIPDVLNQTSASRDAIGFETVFMVDQFRDSAPVKVVKVDGYAPHDLKALASGRYPFYRTYNLTTWEGAANNQNANKLIDYLVQEIHLHSEEYAVVSARDLRAFKWQFSDSELIGSPKK